MSYEVDSPGSYFGSEFKALAHSSYNKRKINMMMNTISSECVKNYQMFDLNICICLIRENSAAFVIKSTDS